MAEPTLEARVRALEQNARRWRLVALAALVLATLARWTPAPAQARGPEAEVRAQRLVLVTREGRELAALEAADQGSRLTLAGPARSRVTLTTDATAPRLALADAAGNDRLWVALRLGSPAIQFLDPAGRARSGFTTFNDDSGVAVISGTTGASPGLVLYGQDRTVKWSAP
jgi:hypothetical protein